MKRYKRYMDGVKASNTLHQRLVKLKAGEKRPTPWKNYGAMAAALALALCLGGFGYSHYYHTVVNPTGQAFLDRTQAYHPDDDPNFATEDPGETEQTGEKTLGSYEYYDPRHVGLGVVSFRILPYIEYGDTYGTKTAMDWDIPAGAVKRELPREEIIALMGGEVAVNTHLDWGEYELTGWAAWYEDGTFWGAYINGLEKEYETDSFEFAVTTGYLPPTCVMYPNSVTQEVRGLTVTADKYDWELGHEGWDLPERRVSFFKDSCGYRFEAASADTEQAERMASRLVCHISAEGLGFDLTNHFAQMRSGICDACGGEIVPGTNHFHLETDTCPECGQSLPVEGEKIHVHTFVDLGKVDPDAPIGFSAAPAESAPPVSVSDSPRGRGEDWCGTPSADPAESREVCHLPLAPEGWNEPSDSGIATKTIVD